MKMVFPNSKTEKNTLLSVIRQYYSILKAIISGFVSRLLAVPTTSCFSSVQYYFDQCVYRMWVRARSLVVVVVLMAGSTWGSAGDEESQLKVGRSIDIFTRSVFVYTQLPLKDYPLKGLSFFTPLKFFKFPVIGDYFAFCLH